MMLLLRSVLSRLLKAKSWVEAQNELFERQIAEWTAYPTPKRKSVVLRGPEDLEARIVPANTDLWVGPAGGNMLFSNAANWSINGAAGKPQDGDTLQFGGTVGNVNGTNTSAIDDIAGLTAGSVLFVGNYNQTLTLNQTLEVTGTFSIAQGTPVTIAGNSSLIIQGAGSSFAWGAGTLNTNVTLGAGGGGGISQSDVTLNARFTNSGTFNWQSRNPDKGPGPNITLGANGTFDNAGTFNIQTASTESIKGQNGSKIENEGTMQKTGVNTTTIQPDFNNSGKLTVNSGMISFDQIVDDTGSIVLNGGNITSVQNIDVEQGASLSGVGTITMLGTSVVSNSGTVTPGVSNVPGTLSIVGGYTQNSFGTLAINLDNAGNVGLLNISGTATLDGTLKVNQYYEPNPPRVLAFMIYKNLNGNFSTTSIGPSNYWPGTGENYYYWATDPTATEYDLYVAESP